MAKKETTPTTLATATPVMQGIQAVDTALKALKHIEESVYKTNGRVGGGFSQNLQSETKVEELIKMMGSVAGRAKSYNDAATYLGITTYPVFKVEGSTVEDYAQDIKLRIAIIQNESKLNKLKAIKAKYTELMDKEDRKAAVDQELQEFLATGGTAE